MFFVKDPQSFKDFTCREHIHRKNNDRYDFFGDLVGSVVSISKQTRKNSPRGIMMTELLNLKVLSNQTSGLVVGGGGGRRRGRGGGETRPVYTLAPIPVWRTYSWLFLEEVPDEVDQSGRWGGGGEGGEDSNPILFINCFYRSQCPI